MALGQVRDQKQSEAPPPEPEAQPEEPAAEEPKAEGQAADEPAWAQLSAIGSGRYYEIPGMPYNWLSNPPSINMLLGVWWLGDLLYPQYYDYDMTEQAQEGFRLLWGYELSDEEAAGMLANSTLRDR